jgi:gliding motility-associated lipoprotein GldH
MLMPVKKVFAVVITLCILVLCGCTSNMVYDQNRFIPKEGWFYKNRAAFDIELTDTARKHNFFVNLRITPDYEYSNLYILLYAKAPSGDSSVRRIDLSPLAATDGKWLGKGTASIISYRIPIVTDFVPSKAGIYHFEIEQNMRTNTLEDVVNVGMAVEKGDVVF